MNDIQLRFPCTDLPPDPLGVPHGPEYRGKLEAGRQSSHSTDYLRRSRKNGCVSHCLGMGERDMQFLLEISPFVLAYRFQYSWPLAKARRMIDDYIFGLTDAPPKLFKKDVISMDVVITSSDGHGGLKYLIGSHKLVSHLHDKKVLRRIALERSEATDAGFAYFVYSRTPGLDEQAKSAKQIMLWGRGIDFNCSRNQAQRVAEAIYRKYDGESIQMCLEKISQYLDLDVEECYQFFSAAIHLGYIFIDLSAPIRYWKSMRLVKRSEARPPWELMERSSIIKNPFGGNFSHHF
jgi:hypothetical protein